MLQAEPAVLVDVGVDLKREEGRGEEGPESDLLITRREKSESSSSASSRKQRPSYVVLVVAEFDVVPFGIIERLGHD